MPSPKQLLIPSSLAQRLLDYLKRRPYEDVAELVAELLRAPVAEVVPPEPTGKV